MSRTARTKRVAGDSIRRPFRSLRVFTRSWHRAKFHVLLCEGNGDDALCAQKALGLSFPEATICTVSSGLETIDYLAGAPPYSNRGAYPVPAVILLDLYLLDITAIEVLRCIRLRSSFSALPVIVLTDYPSAKDEKSFLAAGATALVEKGCRFEGLINQLRKLLPLSVQPNPVHLVSAPFSKAEQHKGSMLLFGVVDELAGGTPGADFVGGNRGPAKGLGAGDFAAGALHVQLT